MADSVLLAMSGGVDSSISAYLLQQQGYEIIGVTFKTFTDKTSQTTIRKAEKSIIDAKIIAQKLNIPHFVENIEIDFKSTVIEYFTKSYLSAKTPNPCVICNPLIKWKYLYKLSEQLNCKYIATGHYVKKKFENGRYFLSEAKDVKKDQTFFLWNLSQNQLEKTIFPLAQYEKTNIKKIANELNFTLLNKKSESYGVCFLGKNNYYNFIENNIKSSEIEKSKGFFIDSNDNIITNHSGIYAYTIGQKIFIDNKIFYIISIDSFTKNIRIGEINELYKYQILIDKINLQKYKSIDEINEFEVAYSYYKDAVKAKFFKKGKSYIIEFESPILAPAIGQSVVLYQNNDLVGGCFIKSIIK